MILVPTWRERPQHLVFTLLVITRKKQKKTNNVERLQPRLIQLRNYITINHVKKHK